MIQRIDMLVLNQIMKEYTSLGIHYDIIAGHIYIQYQIT